MRISGDGSRLDLSRLHLSVDRANPRRYAMATQGRVVLPSGTVEGRATLALGTAVRWDLDLKTDHLDLDRLVGRDLKDTRVRGHLVTAGRAPALDAALLRTADTRIALSLGPGSVYGRVLDSLVLDGTLRQQRLDARFALRQGPSRAQGRIAATPGDLEAPFAFQAALDHFDVGALLVSDTLRTRLTGQIKADVQGCTLNDAAGRIVAELTETTLIWRGRTRSFAPLDAALERDATGEGRLRVRSDLGEADLRGSLRVDALRTVAETYLPRLDARFRSALGHRRGQAAEAPMPAGSAPPALQLQAALTVRDARALDALGLALPVSDSVRLEADLRTGPSGLSVAFTAMADTLRLKGNRRLANVRLRGHVRDDGREAPALTFEAFTDTVIGVPRFGRPMRLAGDVQGSSGRLALRTLVPGATGDGAALRLAFLPDRLRLFVDSLGFGADAYRFTTRQGQIDVYADAAVVEGLVFEANAPGARQRLTLDGSVSGAHSDTMHLRAAGVDVGTILGGRPERAPLGGRLDGDVAVTALLGQPEATGEVTVTTLTFGRHVLGDMTVRSFFRPGEPDVTLDVRLDSSAKIPPGMLATANRLHATGSYRLAGGGQPANLDLDLDATRLDAFFFDYLFPDLVSGTTGRIQARARVHGDPQRPQFTGTFTLRDGRLRVPGYGLAYTVNGRGHVDDDGLYLDDIEAVDGTGGSARVEGAVQFNAYRYVSLELRAALADLRLLDVPTSNDLPFYGRLWASGDATLSGPVDAAVLSASNVVVSPRSEVSIPIRETFAATDPGFIVHADSSG
ncbi:MAG TPA: translocation/assembly module TamB domain-containing protein, partial [Rhodothermales bacterium]|nr:translocation/assembly module TamB domain-containing protein [Rhodothermales bacterium]